VARELAQGTGATEETSNHTGGPRGQFYLIPFIKREEFESAWPHFWKVKSKGAPIILVRSPKTVFPELKVGVLIHSPPLELISGLIRETDRRLGAVWRREARWMWTTYIELVVDGNVVDLNRIPLPADTRSSTSGSRTCRTDVT